MPDNRAKIQHLKDILDSGATSGTVDGQAVNFQSADDLRARIVELQRTDTSTARRPYRRVRTIDLRNAFG